MNTMNIISKLGFKKYYVGAYLLSFVAIAFYLSLYFYSSFYNILEIEVNSLLNNLSFLDFRLLLYVLGFTTVAIVFYVFSLIKCPKCGYKIFWHWFNDSREHRGKGNPVLLTECPNCGYDPEQEADR